MGRSLSWWKGPFCRDPRWTHPYFQYFHDVSDFEKAAPEFEAKGRERGTHRLLQENASSGLGHFDTFWSLFAPTLFIRFLTAWNQPNGYFSRLITIDTWQSFSRTMARKKFSASDFIRRRMSLFDLFEIILKDSLGLHARRSWPLWVLSGLPELSCLQAVASAIEVYADATTEAVG